MIIFMIVMLSLSCIATPQKKDMIGTYVAQDYVNTIDTLRLMANGIYERKVYTKNKELALHTHNEWDLGNDGELVLHAFFFNLDRDLSKFPELTSDSGYQMNIYPRKESGSWLICIEEGERKNCYKQIFF